MKIGSRTLVSYTYTDNQNHNLLKQTYGNGDYASYTYDTYRRPTKLTWEDGATVSYVYGSDGALGRMTDSATGRTTKYYYDFQGLLKQKEETGSSYSNKVTRNYNATNNLTAMTQVVNGVSLTTNYSYDTYNRLSTVSQDIVTGTYTYDTLSRMSKLLTKRSGVQVLALDLTYKAGGNSCTTSGQIATWKNTQYNPTNNGSWVGDTTYSYTYDDKGNITAISDGTNSTTYVYDAKGQLNRENNQAAGKTWVYTYDNGGNILTKKEFAYTTGTPGTATSTKTYTYGDTSWKDLLTAYNGTMLSYDTVGNLTGDGTWTYTWQHGRQLASMSKSGTTASFLYNADGLRVSKTVNGTTTQYHYTGGKLARLVKGSSSLSFVYDSLGPVAVLYNDSTYYYYLRNAQGDVVGIVNSAGEVVASYTYDAWGRLLTATGSMKDTLGSYNPFRYRGYVYDYETKLYYLNSRYYDPAVGRFLNADVFVSTGQGVLGANMYAYCNNNPVNMVDSEGTLAGAIIGGLVGGLVGGFVSAAHGESFWAGAAQGATSGFIAGAAVDLVALPGFGALEAAGVVFLGGAAGSLAGDGMYALCTGQEMKLDRVTIVKAGVSGLMNLAAFGVGKLLIPTSSGSSSTREVINSYFEVSATDVLNADYAVKATLISYANNAIIDSYAQKEGNNSTNKRSYSGNRGGYGGAERSVMMIV